MTGLKKKKKENGLNERERERERETGKKSQNKMIEVDKFVD